MHSNKQYQQGTDVKSQLWQRAATAENSYYYHADIETVNS